MRKGLERQMHRGYGLFHKTGKSEGGRQACRAQKKKFKRVLDKLFEKDYPGNEPLFHQREIDIPR